MNSKIILKNLTKSFVKNKKIKVLNNINFTFRAGKIYSIMGPSGSGKSTLLNILSLLDRPNKGQIIFDRKDLSLSNIEKNDEIRSKNIGIVYQDKNLLGDFTAIENVLLARLALDEKNKKAFEDSKKILKKVGLLNRMDHIPSELSGGESQRIAIARAIINNPQIILADEPTGSLDIKTSKDIFKILFNLKNEKRIIIFATHNRYFANMADCKLHLIDGKIKTINGKFK
jgi:ABC-type lipoprotein export system ATPase subunit